MHVCNFIFLSILSMGISLSATEKSFPNFKCGGGLKLLLSQWWFRRWCLAFLDTLRSVHGTPQLFTWSHRVLASGPAMQEPSPYELPFTIQLQPQPLHFPLQSCPGICYFGIALLISPFGLAVSSPSVLPSQLPLASRVVWYLPPLWFLPSCPCGQTSLVLSPLIVTTSFLQSCHLALQPKVQRS